MLESTGERRVLWHYVGGPPSRRSLCLFWRETRQRVWARDLRRDRKWVRERESRIGQRNPEEGSWRRETQDGSWAVDTGQRRDQSDEIGSSRSEGRPVKTSQLSSWFVEFSLEIHASVSLQGMQCYISSSCTWVNPSPYCSFVLCSFSPIPLVCISCAVKKCAIPLSEPLDDHRPRSEMFRRSWCIGGGGARGYRHIPACSYFSNSA